VQQLLIPDQLPHLRGWMIESEYHPAREVGGASSKSFLIRPTEAF
jgi:hypothetical protein